MKSEIGGQRTEGGTGKLRRMKEAVTAAKQRPGFQLRNKAIRRQGTGRGDEQSPRLAEMRRCCIKQSMSTKEVLLEVAEKLPPDATLVDAIYELEFRQAIEDGLASLDRGERIPLEEARKRIPQWTSKYSSPP